MNRIYLLMLLLISCSLHISAQTDYYYYQGKKIPLTRNEEKVVVSIPKENVETSRRISANTQILSTISDDAFDIRIISRSDFEKLASQDFWEEDSKYVILTSCYFTGSHEEVAATPYLNVRLKSEEDKSLLTSYVEQFNLKITWNSPLMPLWYILAITPESEKNSLECANALYEGSQGDSPSVSKTGIFYQGNRYNGQSGSHIDASYYVCTRKRSEDGSDRLSSQQECHKSRAVRW